MHYNEDAHAHLVATKSPSLDHQVETIRDDVALINFKEGVLNSINTENSSNFINANKFVLFSDGIQQKFDE